ncbi:MAG TPA: sigma factor-like helix-turn-helix DNA-binding protein [Rhizomicrobium sp.]
MEQPGDRLAQPVVPVTRRRPKLFLDYPPQTRDAFFLNVAEIGLSQRAANVCAGIAAQKLGDLAQLTTERLSKLHSCGKRTISEIQERLARFGLELGMELADWEAARAQLDRNRLESIEELRLSLFRLPPTCCLEDELSQIVSTVANERATKIVIRVNGLSGDGHRTLESVGEEYGLTRERIRQIATKALKRLEPRQFSTPWLAAALLLLDQNSPCVAGDFSKRLRAAGITRGNFDIGGIESACEILGQRFEFTTALIAGRKVYGRRERLKRIIRFFRECRQATSRGGCANFDSICDDLKVTSPEREILRELATFGDMCRWLDDDRQWLLAVSCSRNRLSNLVAKVFAVAPSLPLSELRRAVARSRRLEAVPPTGIIANFVVATGLGRVDADVVTASANFGNMVRPGSAEEILVIALQLHGPVLGWERFQELCIRAGMNPVTFGIYASGSPIVARLARGVYSLVGADVSPGAVEEVQRENAVSRRKTEWGWTSRGSLWCALGLTLTNITSGALPVPSFVASFAEGQWQPRFAGKELAAIIKCKGGFVSGLRRPLLNAGGEAGDVCVLEFCPTSRIVNLSIGGEELVDLWDSGNIDLPAQGLGEAEGQSDQDADGIAIGTLQRTVI